MVTLERVRSAGDVSDDWRRGPGPKEKKEELHIGLFLPFPLEQIEQT